MAPNNPLPNWGNEKTMNMNPLILTNIQASPYFKVNLYELKTYHEVIDEIYYKVDHLEPWEKGSRKTAGQTGMCGGVRGVGAGGIVSSAYCLLYKLYTLKLTRKQLMGLITHKDSPYIRGLGFMYIRYCQDPKDMWDWYEPYLDDEEEIDVKAGGGHKMTMGEVLRQWMVKLEWYSTLFPRIPVPIQKDLMQKLKERPPQAPGYQEEEEEEEEPEPEPEREEPRRPRHIPDGEVSFGEAERSVQHRRRRSPHRHSPSRRRSRSPRNDFARELERERRRQERAKRGDRSRSREKQMGHRSRSKERSRKRSRSRSRDKQRQRSRSRSKEQSTHSGSKSHRSRSGSREPKRKKEKKHKHRSRSQERNSKHKSHSKHNRDVEQLSPAREEEHAKNAS
uniref:Pre-mRNA-splicing factor 38 n=1 Tax=Magallana gigas TaxID=29159 RepID=K1Q5L4_MAGGI